MTAPRIPTPEELDSNPELAILAALDSVARAARFAVIAIHPPLRDPVHDLTDPSSTDRPASPKTSERGGVKNAFKPDLPLLKGVCQNNLKQRERDSG